VDLPLVARMARRVAGALGVTAAAGPPQPVPERAFDGRRRQYRSSAFLAQLGQLRQAMPAEPPRPYLLGVTDADLFVPQLNFVFGEADRAAEVAVISLARLRPQFYGAAPDPRLLEERAMKEAIHELGHVYGLAHCPDPACIMHFSNTIEDTDRKGPGFCRRCEARLMGLKGQG
jgi:archaemetzincin